MLRLCEEILKGTTQVVEPEAGINQFGVPACQDTLELDQFAALHKTFQVPKGDAQDGGCGGFVELSAFDAEEPILDDIRATNPVQPAQAGQLATRSRGSTG